MIYFGHGAPFCRFLGGFLAVFVLQASVGGAQGLPTSHGCAGPFSSDASGVTLELTAVRTGRINAGVLCRWRIGEAGQATHLNFTGVVPAGTELLIFGAPAQCSAFLLQLALVLRRGLHLVGSFDYINVILLVIR